MMTFAWLAIGALSIAYMIYEDGIKVGEIHIAFFGIFLGPIATAVIIHHYVSSLSDKRLIRPRSERK